MSGHSRNSASKFEAEALCPGRRVMTAGMPRTTSRYAAEGTAAHKVFEWCLRDGKDAAAFAGRLINVDGYTFAVDDDMVEAVQTALDNVREAAGGALILAETRVYYNEALGTTPDESWGTADAIALLPDELQVHDLKYGRGVEVDAHENVQMRLYALGALQLLDQVADTEGLRRVRMFVHQPRVKSAPSEFCEHPTKLREWGHKEARRALDEINGAERMRGPGSPLSQEEWERIYLRPNEKSCTFCEARATCPALARYVDESIKQAPRSAADPSEFE